MEIWQDAIAEVLVYDIIYFLVIFLFIPMNCISFVMQFVV